MHKGPGAPSGRNPDDLRREDRDGEKAGLRERAMYYVMWLLSFYLEGFA